MARVEGPRPSLAGIVAVCVMLMTASGAGAQIPDPAQLRELLQQRSGNAAQPVTSPLDRARETSAEEERRRQEDEAALGRSGAKPLSRIERDFNVRLGLLDAYRQRLQQDAGGDSRHIDQDTEDLILRQFGYRMFEELRGTPGPMSGRLPEDYILGIGDELVVTLVGSTNRTLTTRVDREGRLVIPEMAPLPAAGREFGEVRADLERMVGQMLLGTEVYLSVGSLRQIGVTVVGEVTSPGLYTVTGLTDVIHLLALSGGVRKTGSLRNIVVDSAGSRRRIDLYRLMSGADDSDLTVRDGDRVIVPLIGPTVAVAGLVVRPGIYEVGAEEATPLDSVLALAGGTLRPRGVVARRNRVDEGGRQQIRNIDFRDHILPGDAITIMPEREIRVGQVMIEGHVRQAGVRALESTPTLADLLTGGEALDDSPYLPFAILETTDPLTLQRVYQPVDLGPVLAGAENINLKDQDRLIVLGPEEVDYLSSTAVRGAVLEPGAVNPEACPAIVSIARRAQQADTERLSAVARSVFVSTSGTSQPADREGIRQAAAASSDEVVSTAQLGAEASRRQACNAFFDQRPDLLALAVEYSVAAIGAVRVPGLYPVAGRATLRDLVAAAGGLTLSADPSAVEISTFRGDGALVSKGAVRRYVDLRETSLAQVDIAPGSAVRVAAQQAALESGTVLLSGEFLRPGVYTLAKGETLLGLIERAGGMTDQAYPYGAVFTRVRVQQEQQDSFRRTARELNNALALAMLKNDVSGDAVTAASGLIASFSSVEAVGRMVIEADPAVLRLEREKDFILESGDTLFMPKRPNFVLTAGDLLNPGALQFRPGKSLDDYLDEAGGFQRSADENRVFVVYPNGVAQPVTLSLWTRSRVDLPPGSTIVVPKDVNPLATLNIVTSLTQVLSGLALSAASIAVISDNSN